VPADRRGGPPAARGDGEAEPGRDRGDAEGEPGHCGRWRSRAVLRLAIAAIVLLSLVPGRWRSRAVLRLLIAAVGLLSLGAMAKPSRVETGAMP